MSNASRSQNPALRDPLDGSHVSYAFSCRDVHDVFVVTAFECVEELGHPYRLTVELTAEDEASDSLELLGRDVSFHIERGDAYEQVFHGLVDRITLHDNGETLQTCSVVVVPALVSLRRTENTRIFQGKTALEAVQDVLTESLTPYGREFDVTSVDASRLATRDYCVQYRESNLDFVHRLLEEEGIGYHFVHAEEGPEKLILFDDNRHFERTPSIGGGPIRYDATVGHRAGAEPILRFQGSSRRTSTSVTTRDHDWTRVMTQQVQGAASIEGPVEGSHRTRERHEVYEHGLERHLTIHEHSELAGAMLATLHAAVLPNGLPLGLEHRVHNLDGAVFDSFSSNNAEDRALVRAQTLGRDAHTFKGRSLVRSLSPGRRFEMIGHPTLGADGEYFITKVVHTSAVAGLDAERDDGLIEWGETNYGNRFECLGISRKNGVQKSCPVDLSVFCSGNARRQEVG